MFSSPEPVCCENKRAAREAALPPEFASRVEHAHDLMRARVDDDDLIADEKESYKLIKHDER